MDETVSRYKVPSEIGLDRLIRALIDRGFDVIGPTIRDQAVMLGSLTSANELPRGVADRQDKGLYRLEPASASSGTFFGFNLGPNSWKSYLFPENRRLWKMSRNGAASADRSEERPLAFFGVRACELAAIAIQDKVFIGDGPQPLDPHYARLRTEAFIVGVHCATAAPTCFCPSMGTGPEFPTAGWDILMTETADHVYFEAASEKGQAVLAGLGWVPTLDDVTAIVTDQLATTRSRIRRAMDQTNIKELIYGSLDSTQWQEVGARCLACANCTLVCPTCFCSTVDDVTDVEGEHAERWQQWDSCFHIDFSYIHGGSRRVSTAERYRQWFSHKLASWYDQFGSSGCVGCGRCIAWCPVGIDITEEMAVLRSGAEGPPSAHPSAPIVTAEGDRLGDRGDHREGFGKP